MMLKGLIGNQGKVAQQEGEMIFFVNQRPVDSKTLSYATIEAFHTFVPKEGFPLQSYF